MKNILFLTLFLCSFFIISTHVQAQQYNDKSFQEVDSIAMLAKPREAYQLVKAIYAYANKSNNTTLSVKAAIYKMRYQSILEEDAIDSVIYNLKTDIAKAQQPQKSILQSILAALFWDYLSQNEYRISKRTELLIETSENINTWSVAKLKKETTDYLLQSISQKEILQKIDLKEIQPLLNTDSSSRIFRPTLYDLLAQVAISILSSSDYQNTRFKDIKKYMDNPFMSTAQFIAYPFLSNDTSRIYHLLKIFQNLAQFHNRNKHEDALADVELQRMKYIHQLPPKTHYKALDTALDSLAMQFENTEIFADIQYERALLYKNQEILPTDPKMYLAEAVELAKKAIKAYPNSIGASNANNLIKKIKEQSFNFKIKYRHQPGKPIAIYFEHQNIDTLYLNIYKTSINQVDMNNAFDKRDFGKLLHNGSALKTWTVILPKTKDYLQHSYLDKIEGLPRGRYLITASSAQDTTENSIDKYNTIEVTQITANYRKKGSAIEYSVFDSSKGTAIVNAEIQERSYSNLFQFEGEKTLTNKGGLAISSPAQGSRYALITYKGDSSIIRINTYSNSPNKEYKKVVLFTDRAIYRPGQTIYFKGIVLNPDEEKNNIVPDAKIEVKFLDVNHKEIEVKELISNEFGSIQGSFVIPNGKLNGWMTLSTEYGRVSINVEEYKRPTFEIVFDKANQKYKLNDSIKISGKANTFAGYALSNTAFQYKIYRRLMPKWERFTYSPGSIEIIAEDSARTNNKGIFEFKFKALPEHDAPSNFYNYMVSVTLTANNGETRQGETSILVGDKDLQVNSQIPQQIFLGQKQDTLSYQITNLNNEIIQATGNIKWQLLKSPDRLTNNAYKAEKYSLSREEWIKDFPTEEYNDENNVQKWGVENTAWSKTLTTDKNGLINFNISAKDLQPGYYKVDAEVINKYNDTLVNSLIVRVFHKNTPNIILTPNEWLIAEKTTIKPNEKAIFHLAGLQKDTKLYYEVYYRNRIENQSTILVSPNQTVLEIPAKPYYEGDFAVRFFMINNGTVYSTLQQINIDDPSKQLDIKFLSFRDKLQPGEKEQWKLKITNKAGEKEIAEMVATLYDASLDKFRPLQWNEINRNLAYNYEGYQWVNPLNQTVNSQKIWYPRLNIYRNYTRIYERLNLFGYEYLSGYNSMYRNYIRQITANKSKEELLNKFAKSNFVYGIITDIMKFSIPGVIVKNGKKTTISLQNGIYAIDAKAGDVLKFSYIGFIEEIVKVGKNKRIDVVMKDSPQSLNEVTVSGYTSKNKEMTVGSANRNLTYTLAGTNLQSAPVASVTDLLQGKVAGLNIQQDQNNSERRGSFPVRGLSEISVRGLSEGSNYTAINPRTNFNETAFFYPQLKTNEQGEIDIEFTIPQSLTQYKMMGFAHTKDLKTASITNQLITQKQLAISVNAPRFFREADTVWLAATANNISGKVLKGKVILELRDALRNNKLNINQSLAEQSLSIADGASQTLKWKLIIPQQVSAITYKVLAIADKHTDGEEMTIPVLPNHIIITESLPMNVRGNTTKTFNFERLINSSSSNTLRHQSLTLEYTANPTWYAIQALPYLMEYPYECAEQTFSRFYANSFATGIINSSPQIRQVFEQWNKTDKDKALLSNLEKNQELKSILLEETPWVRQAENETERKKRLATLFDLNRMSYELKENFDKLKHLQLSNGAFPWFAGMNENRYITQHIILGFGQLQKSKLINEDRASQIKSLTNKALIYLDNNLIIDYQEDLKYKNYSSHIPLHYLFARSYYNHQNNSPIFKKAFQFYLNKVKENWMSFDSYQQAQTALVLMRNNQKEEAQKIITFLKQTAQYSDEMGMYWKDNKLGWWWYQNPIETQALLIEAFDEVANDQKSVEEMKIWLLKNKQTNDWKTTKATVAACYALLMRGYNLLADNHSADIQLGSQKLEHFKAPNTSTEAGTGYEKVSIPAQEISPELGKITIVNKNKGIAWGAMYWQYFETSDKVTSSNTGIKIRKQLFKVKSTNGKELLTSLNEKNILSTGDLVRVRIEIYADRNMEFLHLKDMRSSGFEPVNIFSGYRYQDGLGYYQSTKDASTNFFIDTMRKGTYVFEYDLRVSHAGNFSNGITSLQSMYAPEFTTYSEGIRVRVE